MPCHPLKAQPDFLKHILRQRCIPHQGVEVRLNQRTTFQKLPHLMIQGGIILIAVATDALPRYVTPHAAHLSATRA